MKKRWALLISIAVICTGAMVALWSLDRAKARAEFINCASSLCALGLGARTYAMDNTNVFASDIRAMSNELSTPKILMCPSDKKPRPQSFTNLSPQAVTYEYVGANAIYDLDKATNALFRCPIHDHVVYDDGRIVRGDGTVQYGKTSF